MSSSGVNRQNFLIPLKEIHLATQKFSPGSRIGHDGFGAIYRGQLSDHWQNRTATFKRFDPTGPGEEDVFQTEVEMRSNFNHENILAFIGYCDEGIEKIIVSEYPVHGSVDVHLKDARKRSCLTWAQRLKICIDAATGLEYLHSGLRNNSRAIHRDMKSANIMLDVNLEAKISGFGLSLLVDRNLPEVYKRAVGGVNFYLDPICNESGMVRLETDVYSFGVVMFEMLSGMLASEKRSIGNNQPQSLLNLVRRYYHEGLEVIIDPYIRDQINIRSFRVFKDVAYQCISLNLVDRPTMNSIIKRIQEAENIELLERASTMRSLQPPNLKSFLIPLMEIKWATRDFSPETRIAVAGHGVVYKGRLSPLWQNITVAIKRFGHREKNEFLAKIMSISSLQNENIQHDAKHDFSTHLQMMPNFNHENIIRFIGYCDEYNEMIIVSEYAMNGSLHDFLEDHYKWRFVTWAVRLKICIGVARGLEYLHSGQGGAGRVIHRDIRSTNILLDRNLEAKISGFGLSILVDRNQSQDDVGVLGNQYYLDPISNGMVNIDSDIYSFGVVMFELLSGMLAHKRRSVGGDQPETLISLVRRHYDDRSDILIDNDIRNYINMDSLRVFKKIAYRCISLSLKDRPSMKRIIKRMEEALLLQQLQGSTSTITKRTPQYQNLENYLIPFKEISLATRDFSPETQIGVGGFGMVYKGQLSQRWQNCMVAIKRLDLTGHQGKNEFLTELKLISRFHHPNIIPFVGYCDEANEMISVYEYACNGSLDYHLENLEKRQNLTWAQRLMISLGAAKGLDYLHTGLGKDNRVIHRDIKSGNILLDENMQAKICDFGLSKEGPRNQQCTDVFTKVAGTNFYLDPIYHESGILRKESDVYSFGVVLFELLSGRPAYGLISFVDGNPQALINLARRYHNDGPEKLIDPLIRDQIDSRCFHMFKEIAYKCISYNSGERPTMDTIIDAIEDAIDFQLSTSI